MAPQPASTVHTPRGHILATLPDGRSVALDAVARKPGPPPYAQSAAKHSEHDAIGVARLNWAEKVRTRLCKPLSRQHAMCRGALTPAVLLQAARGRGGHRCRAAAMGI